MFPLMEPVEPLKRHAPLDRRESQIFSFVEGSKGLKPVRVEVTLLPGLPEFVVTGLPDQALKESLVRLRAALKAGGFQLPRAEKVIFNLSPADERKKSRGLELALALSFLQETGQWQSECDEIFAYGELGLKGEVRFLPELEWLEGRTTGSEIKLWSGVPPGRTRLSGLHGLDSITQVYQPKVITGDVTLFETFRRPHAPVLSWDTTAARLQAVAALGQHHTLLVGPAGSGKTTMARSIGSLIPTPPHELQVEIEFWDNYFRRPGGTRPFEDPHHSSTVQALLGGGQPPVPGVITRAHGGVLLMDEFLEFAPRVREGLRETMESGEITIARRGHVEKWPARFQLIATSNLCPCGKMIPHQPRPPCRFGETKCQSYQQRMSGPLLDRFEILAMSGQWSKKGSVSTEQILAEVDRGHEFRKIRLARDYDPDLRSLPVPAAAAIPEVLFHLLPTNLTSRRRQLAILNVARTVADLNTHDNITRHDLEEGIELANRAFF
jgi:magnesium chelatase family protein